jgi:hypothetical protein
MFVAAVVQALQIFEQNFWEEFFSVEGESNCIFWAKLVGIFDPDVQSIVTALALREAGDALQWDNIAREVQLPPPVPASFNYWSNDMTGFMQWFDGFYV